MMSNRKKEESQAVKVARKILEANNINFGKWRQDVIQKRKFEYFENMGAKWEAEVFEEECYKFIVLEFDKKLG